MYMRDFKFLNDNEKNPFGDEFTYALGVGREYYLNGNDIDENPFENPILSEAFEQGWELEQDYEILRQARQRANEG